MKILSRSDLGYRLTQSYSRNESKWYKPEFIWTADKNSWSADWEGRTVLALVSLAKATGKEPSYLEEILRLLPIHLNEQGYLGPIYPNGGISEQSLAGHSWLLRGLIEYSLFKKTDKVKGIIETILKNLYMPVVEEIDNYYINHYEKDGTYSGSIISVKGKWLMSSDIGCAFISLDGISHAYEYLGWEWLKDYVLKMHEKFKQVDLYGGTFQTHATLSCLRGLIRTYNIVKDPELLNTVKEKFDFYVKNGTTENYSNCNRFNVAKWTEPCAIFDSYMCAVELYKITKESEYLDFAQKVYFNSISHIQLPNGGMGLENCPGYHGISKLGWNRRATGEIYEAYWCCTMRGGDGLAYVSQNQCLKEDNVYTFVNFFDCAVVDDEVTIEEITQYPKRGSAIFVINNPKAKEIVLRLFVPSFVRNVKINGNAQSVADGFVVVSTNATIKQLEIEFDIPLIKMPCNGAGYGFKYMHGNVLLGAYTNEESVGNFYWVKDCEYKTDSGITFDRIGNTIYKQPSDLDKEDVKILFGK
ncbi:MAG: glycoside hydrolase family 127 protein [Clostridia bacterium]|nr:glycoside hydrolase family 127 protein [Clostridia bacterium]